MAYRRCGTSGLKLPMLSLGAWETFGGYRGGDVARQCIFGAFNLGITHFDLANNYGQPPGQAETVVGAILAELPRDEIIVSGDFTIRFLPAVNRWPTKIEPRYNI
jgi:L-glyceraldehyde 3-phosphate reductase